MKSLSLTTKNANLIATGSATGTTFIEKTLEKSVVDTKEAINISTYLDEHFINETYLDNVSSLREKLNAERLEILKLLDKVNDRKNIDGLIERSREAIKELEDQEKSRERLSSELNEQQEEHQQGQIDRLAKCTKLINQLTRIKKYFQLLWIIQMFNNQVYECVERLDLTQSLKPLGNLIELQHNLNALEMPSVVKMESEEGSTFSCPHLTKVINYLVQEIAKTLEVKMKDQLSQSLKDIHWINIETFEKQNIPIPSSTGTTSASNTSTKELEEKAKNDEILQRESKLVIKNTFISNFVNLLLLQLNTLKYTKTNSSTRLLAIDQLLEPLIKGFKYHFQTSRVTNILEKPEWPIHYVKKLIKDHSSYLNLLEGTLVRSHGIHYIDIHHWFISGLVETINAKFKSEISLFLEKSEYRKFFYHTMEEIIGFQKYLQEVYSYPNPVEFGQIKSDIGLHLGPGKDLVQIALPFSLFRDPFIFDRWLQLEIKSCNEYFNTMMVNSDRFTLFYKDEFPDVDQMKPTNSAYNLISLLRSLKDRYWLLSDTSLQFQFFIQIQMDLLLKYKHELSIVLPSDRFLSSWSSRSNQSDPWSEIQLREICLIYNSIHYIVSVLHEWDDELLYIEIYDYMNSQNDQTLSSSKGDESFSAFTPVINNFKLLGKQLIRKLNNNLFNCFVTKIDGYLKRPTFTKANKQSQQPMQPKLQPNTPINNNNNTNTKPNHNQQKNLGPDGNELDIYENESTISLTSMTSISDVSNEILDGLTIIRYQLAIIYKSLTFSKVTTLLIKLLNTLDSYLFQLLHDFKTKFTFNDSIQFCKDMNTLLLIFSSFSIKPENYMKKIGEVCEIFKMKDKDFFKFREDYKTKSYGGLERELLNSHSIYTLTTEQLNLVLSLRV
ncbi:hypothetical protein DLAC_04867 [Tieghemostelium lacteum]|uniref:Uncharacterized protein n=1 Tax=Tieghemostelium lacteum TaxID=361077 RepID=A0A151ZJ88_TIELA|nr:hypothetical protein DLAC_04867 [Tieghemostelium lacteum]|eukprot:KYQ93975.1 hypothetical protein DLAC_04867 [Tieghemostelium lacteum]